MAKLKSKIKIIPRGKWILVKPEDPAENKTISGLIIPATNEQEQKAQGVVVAVGEEPKGLKIGDRIVYGTYAGEDMTIREGSEEVEYKILLEEDVIAFLK